MYKEIDGVRYYTADEKVDWFGIICAVIAGIAVAYFVVRLAM